MFFFISLDIISGELYTSYVSTNVFGENSLRSYSPHSYDEVGNDFERQYEEEYGGFSVNAVKESTR
jgi:hypothetical protein